MEPRYSLKCPKCGCISWDKEIISKCPICNTQISTSNTQKLSILDTFQVNHNVDVHLMAENIIAWYQESITDKTFRQSKTFEDLCNQLSYIGKRYGSKFSELAHKEKIKANVIMLRIFLMIKFHDYYNNFKMKNFQ